MSIPLLRLGTSTLRFAWSGRSIRGSENAFGRSLGIDRRDVDFNHGPLRSNEPLALDEGLHSIRIGPLASFLAARCDDPPAVLITLTGQENGYVAGIPRLATA